MPPKLLESPLLFGFTQSLCFGGALGLGIISPVIDEFLFLLSGWQRRVFSFDALEGITEPIFSCWKWGIWGNFISVEFVVWCQSGSWGSTGVSPNGAVKHHGGSGWKWQWQELYKNVLAEEERLLLYYQANFFWLLPFLNVSISTNTGQIFIQYLHSASVHQKVKSGGDFCRQSQFLHSVQLSQAVKKLYGNVSLH